MIRIESIAVGMDTPYYDFLLCDERSLIYATLEYRDFLLRAVGGEATYLVARDELGQIVGVLPFFSIESPGIGKVINSLPWYGSYGGCIVTGNHAALARRELLNQFRRHAEAPGVLSATVILSPFEEEFLPVYRDTLSPSAYDHRIGQLTQLPTLTDKTEKELEAKLQQKTRNLARKSLKQGFDLRERNDEEAWKFLYETHVENMLAVQGKHKPWDHFVALRETLPPHSRRLLIAELGGVPVAGLLLLYFNKTVEYVTPVIKLAYRSQQPLSFLIWHGMLDAIRQGYSWWNWGGTWVSQESLHHFKAGWGAVDMPYTYVITSSPAGRAKLSEHRANLGELFPFFYTYPYAQLCQ